MVKAILRRLFKTVEECAARPRPVPSDSWHLLARREESEAGYTHLGQLADGDGVQPSLQTQ
eukprot:2385069-Prymnesium_polylepis.1